MKSAADGYNLEVNSEVDERYHLEKATHAACKYLKKEKELPGNWIKCFYNKDQAMKAYKLAERLLEEKYEWPKKEKNWLKLNLAVLEQMYARIDRL